MRASLDRLGSLRGPLAILAVVTFVSSLGIGVMLPVIPLYAIALGATPLQLGLMTSAFALANTAGQLASGLVLDRYGTLPFLRLGTAIYAFANGLAATATNAVSLIAYRALAGLGAGGNLLASRVYLTQIAPPERLAYVNGVLGAAGSAGTVLGPALGGLVAQAFDLRGPFIVVALTSTLALLGLFALPRPSAAAEATDGGPASALNRSVLVLLVANFFLTAGFGGFITTYAPFATGVLGWTALEVGLIFSIFGGGSVVLGPWLGGLADRTGRRRVAVAGTLPVALFGITLVYAFPRPALWATTFAAGAGIAAFTAAWFALLSSASPRARRGRVFGIVSAISNLGMVFGALVASTVWQLADVGAGVLTASVAVIFSGVTLLVLPREQPASERDAAAASLAVS